MKKYGIGFVIGLVLLPLLAYGLAWTGQLPVATASGPMPLERRFAKTALHAVLRHNAPATPQGLTADQTTLLGGAQVYTTHCAFCHGYASGKASPAAQGMYPPPPQLLQGDDMVTDDPVGVTFWKADNGIRLTGMPGFHASLTEAQLWSVSVLLAHADHLPPTVTAALQPVPAAAPVPPTAQPATARPRR